MGGLPKGFVPREAPPITLAPYDDIRRRAVLPKGTSHRGLILFTSNGFLL